MWSQRTALPQPQLPVEHGRPPDSAPPTAPRSTDAYGQLRRQDKAATLWLDETGPSRGAGSRLQARTSFSNRDGEGGFDVPDPLAEPKHASPWMWGAGTEAPSVLVLHPETICNVAKRQGRLQRRAGPAAGTVSPPSSAAERLHTARLQKESVAAAMSVGRNTAAKTRIVNAARERAATSAARRQFNQGTANMLGSNLTMVRRHMLMEDITRDQESRLQAKTMATAGLRSRLEEQQRQLKANVANETERRRVGRAKHKATLRDGHDKVQRDKAAHEQQLREAHEALQLHLNDNTSTIVDPAEGYEASKASAIKLSDLRRTIAEEQQRVLDVRTARLKALAVDKEQRLAAHVPRVAPAVPVQVDGSDVFHALSPTSLASRPVDQPALSMASGADPAVDPMLSEYSDDPLAVSQSFFVPFSPGPTSVPPMFSPESGVTVECKLPAAMMAAKRVFRMGEVEATTAPFNSSAAKVTHLSPRR